MADPKVRRAVSAAQAVLRESTPSMQIDGKPGTFTLSSYKSAPAEARADVDRLLLALGAGGNMQKLHDQYKSEKTVAVKRSDASSIFDLQVVPALIRYARQNKIDPMWAVGQVALESTWGRSTPRAEDGGPSYNYAGIKWNSVKTKKKATAKTKEFVAGKEISISDAFAVFDSPDDFARQFFDYLLRGPSSYRYKGLANAKTPLEYGAILAKGGYATDPAYPSKISSMAKSAERKYA